MPLEALTRPTNAAQTWEAAQSELTNAQQSLAAAPAGIARQKPYDVLLTAERRCTTIVHGWFAEALSLQRVERPRAILSLDVDGVLEDDSEGFSCTNLAGAAALRLLELGAVAVLLNTARSLLDVQQRVQDFKLLGAIGSLGASVWDGVFDREYCLLSDRGAAQIDQVRAVFRQDSTMLVEPAYTCSARASKMISNKLGPITGEDARRLLDRGGLSELTFWVAPRHTDFVDRNADKAKGIERLQHELGLDSLPLAAMGDSACDLPMLKAAQVAVLPAATLPSYLPPRRQRLLRSRHLGGQALWEAACHLAPNVGLQRQVLSIVQDLRMPDWMPESLRRPPVISRALLPRLATALTTRYRNH